jgi:hypothetical protein
MPNNQSMSMMLFTSTWGPRKTFKMVPVDKSCPFNEAIYDPDSKVLGVISKERKQTFHMVPKLTENGDVQYLKMGKKSNGKDYAEERKSIESFYEYYIEDNTEIEQFITMFAENHETFDYKKYLEESPAAASQGPSILTSL